MNARKRRWLGKLGILLFAQMIVGFIVCNIARDGGTFECLFAQKLLIGLLLVLAMAGLVVMRSMILNLPGSTPHTIVAVILAVVNTIIMFTTPLETNCSNMVICEFVWPISFLVWLLGTAVIIVIDAINLP